MAKIGNRVKETTTTTGTGTLDLGGAATGFRAFSEEFTSGDAVYYLIVDDPDSPTEYEYGEGTYTSGSPDTLSRDTVEGSSNSDAKVSWSAGTKTVIATPTAQAFNDFIAADDVLTFTNKTIDGDDNTLQDIATSSLKTRTGSDGSVVTGTAGTNGNLGKWDANGDMVDGPTPPTGAVVGTTDTQTLSGKTLTSPVINTGVSGTAVLDDDTMATASDTTLATSESIKAYVDNNGGSWTYTSPTTMTGAANFTITGIPSTATTVEVLMYGASLDTPAGTGNLFLKLGTSGGIESTGYTQSSASTGQFDFLTVDDASDLYTMKATLSRATASSSTWIMDAITGRNGSTASEAHAGSKAVSGDLDRVQIGNDNPTNWDAGTFIVRYQ